MSNPELLLYVAHLAFWATFGLAGRYAARRPAEASWAGSVAPAVSASVTAPYSRAVLAVHFLAFTVMYFGLGWAILGHQVPSFFAGQRIVGLSVLVSGAVLMAWARVWFQSWRFRARLDAGHQLATGGPFGYLRHPIYMGLNLLALGSAIWVPTPLTWVAVLLMFFGSDLRARAEERVLISAFGPAYQTYRARTARFIPGVY